MDNEKNECVTKKIKAFGIVQGVGFRPLVYRIAQKYGISGTVQNVGGYVEIILQASPGAVDLFLEELKHNNQSGCEIIKLETEDIPYREFNDFMILNSENSEKISIIPPDLPVCPQCQKELNEESDRRFHNPFISCMSCGPRYTIIEDLPYDRCNTTMKDFNMCDLCNREYTSPDSRRFHAQTISCNDCGPYLIFHENSNDSSGSRLEKQVKDTVTDLFHKAAFDRAVAILKTGGIIAVKGIGGYHFVCSPFMEDSVLRLRKLKGREEKPFAIMFHSIAETENYCILSQEERALLKSNARPIVLLSMHNNTMAPSVNKRSIYCGAFIPYTPLQLMLTEKCGPLIMTSANISNQPIIKEDDVILSLKSGYLNGILYNKRRIIRSVDDSVARIIDKKPQLIRRSRGYVPYPVFINQDMISKQHTNLLKNPEIFAAGGDLKATFCLYKNSQAVVSQYFGDLEETSVIEEYKTSYEDLLRLLMITPSLAVCDLHPNYHSAKFAKTLGMPLLQVQHHHSHIASVMAEHDLKGRVIGVAFDGTGYGTDGNIWGGEFLICEGERFIRAAHLSYVPMIGGDQSMKDAAKTSACYLMKYGLDRYVNDERRDIIKSALQHNINSVLTSSMGRLFDAVTAILNLEQENHFEGECAALLEREAVNAAKNNIEPEKLAFAICEKGEIIELDAGPLLETLCRLRETRTAGALALGFHYAVAEAIGEICVRLRKKYDCNTAALSGGVFQNTILTEQTLKILRQKKFNVYINMAVPPNDGAISLGQTYIGLQHLFGKI